MFRYKYLVKLIVWEYVIALVIISVALNFNFIEEINKLENVITQQGYRIDILEALAEANLTIKAKAAVKENSESQTKQVSNKSNNDTFRITAYCSCEKCCGKWAVINGGGITASGTKVKEGRTIAVCKSQIPFGTEVYIEGMGIYIAEDTGSAIKENCIDVYFDSHEEAWNFGVKHLNVEW